MAPARASGESDSIFYDMLISNQQKFSCAICKSDFRKKFVLHVMIYNPSFDVEQRLRLPTEWRRQIESLDVATINGFHAIQFDVVASRDNDATVAPLCEHADIRQVAAS